VLEVEKLNAGYKELHILFDVDAKIHRNSITAVVGPNGSGKSTFLKSIFGLTTIYGGKIVYEGKDITRVPPHEKTKMGIAYLPQTDNVFANLSVEENLKIAGYTIDREEFEDRVELALSMFPELQTKMKRKAGTLSGGERQFLAMAMALIKNAKLMMLDEPTAMLSPKYASVIFEKIQFLRDELKMTILLVEQNVLKALEISDYAYMLVSGRVVFGGKSEELVRHEKFEQLCVGYTL